MFIHVPFPFPRTAVFDRYVFVVTILGDFCRLWLPLVAVERIQCITDSYVSSFRLHLNYTSSLEILQKSSRILSHHQQTVEHILVKSILQSLKTEPIYTIRN